MVPRLVGTAIVIAVALGGYHALIHWGDDRAPLAIDAPFQRSAAIVPTPPGGHAPRAIPDPYALYAPCLLAPRNVPIIQRRIA